jgi:hypothetical protein
LRAARHDWCGSWAIWRTLLAAERLLRRLGIRLNDETILRQLLVAALVDPQRARIIGIEG